MPTAILNGGEKFKYHFSFKPQARNQESDKWFNFYPVFHRLCITLSPATYFDDRMCLHSCITTILGLLGFLAQITLGLNAWFNILWIALFLIPWGRFFLYFPIYSGIDDCEHPQWGFYLYREGKGMFTSFWLCKGNKNKCYYMPWDYEHYRKSMLLNTPLANTILKVDAMATDKAMLSYWEHSMKGNRKEFWKDEWKDKIYSIALPYKYVLKSGTVQERIATCRVEEMEWRWRKLMFLPFPRIVRRSIEVNFNDEVGERSGSWKGGTIGCGYTMLKGESIEDCLRRMEKERKF